MLFRKNMERFCAHCEHAGKIDDDTMVCAYYGIVPCTHHCRRFRYDPLKRIPGRMKAAEDSKQTPPDYSL